MPADRATRANPSHRTFLLLYARSGNRCAFPKCPNPITLNETLLGEVAHIKASSPNGPRYDPDQTEEERRSYENLILLCGVHHKFVDDDEEAYTVSRLQKMKADHEAKVTPASEEDAETAAGLFIQGNHNIVAGTLNNSGVMQQIHNYYGTAAPLPINPSEFPAVIPKDGQSRFRAKGEKIGTAEVSAFSGGSDGLIDVHLKDGPSLWLRLFPHQRLPRELRVSELHRFRYKLTTILHSAEQTVTAPDGFGRYRPANNMAHAGAVSFFFRTGELWSIDLAGFFHGNIGQFFAFHETRDALLAHLPNFGEIMTDAGIPPPFRWVAGVENVEGFRLNAGIPGSSPYFDNTRFLVDRVIATGSYSPGDEPAAALDDFFEALFAECGAHRPDHLVYKPKNDAG